LSSGPAPTGVDGELAVDLYRRMLRIRHFEEQVNELYRGGKMPGLAHLYSGEEAVAVGVCAALNHDDYITSTHRGHGHCLAKGAELNPMFAELLGKEAGYCHGKGGSMHIADTKRGNLGANAIVAGSTGIATGAALSAKKRGTKQVAVCFFGDGALGQGVLLQGVEPGVDDVPQGALRGVGRGQPLAQPAVDGLQAVQRRLRLGHLHLGGGEAQLAGPVGQPAGEEGLAAAVVAADGLEHGPAALDGQ